VSGITRRGGKVCDAHGFELGYHPARQCVLGHLVAFVPVRDLTTQNQKKPLVQILSFLLRDT
jgi:hypothetical protein